jgi:hypothetical protein
MDVAAEKATELPRLGKQMMKLCPSTPFEMPPQARSSSDSTYRPATAIIREPAGVVRERGGDVIGGTCACRARSRKKGRKRFKKEEVETCISCVLSARAVVAPVRSKSPQGSTRNTAEDEMKALRTPATLK